MNNISDHLPIILQCSLTQPKVYQYLAYTNRTINDRAKSKFNASLRSADWEVVIDACKLNDPSVVIWYTVFVNLLIDKYKDLYDIAFSVAHCISCMYIQASGVARGVRGQAPPGAKVGGAKMSKIFKKFLINF